jgi:ribosome-binding ATPase YchF (GTP1/OBG family)
LKIGLVGFGASGKTSVFAALTGAETPGGKGALGTVHVPDERIDRLAQMWSPRKTTYAEIVFEDFAPGSFGAGTISAAVLGEMRTLDVLAEVVDGFSAGSAECLRAAESCHAELFIG